MRSPRLATLIARVAVLLSASVAIAAAPRALYVRVASPGAEPETTWIETGGNGARVYSDVAGVRVALPGPIPETRWIVRLEESAGGPALPGGASFPARVAARHALADRFVSQLARREPARFGARGAAGIRVVGAYDRLIAGVVLEAPASALAELRATPGVHTVEPDRPVHAFLDRSVPQVRGDLVRTLLHGTGHGVRVGIVDTGIDYHHAAFGGAFGPGSRVAGGDDLVNHDGDPMDDNGHGTHVAGIVAGNGGGVVGMAVDATLYVYKALNQYGGGLVSDVIAGLERCADPDQDPATDDRLDVVNMSLGAYGGDPDDAFSSAVDALDALGTTVVVAAGNNGLPFTIGDPAIARGALAVGATTRADTTARFSSRGPGPDLAPKPDMVAPGDEIVSAALGGGKVAMSGTSMAAPHVAGAAALLIQLHPDWTHDEVRAALVGASVNLGRSILDQGAGRLDAYAAATATLFASPSRISFGRVLPLGPDTVLTRTLRIRSHAAASEAVTIDVQHEYRSPGVEVTVEPAAFALAPFGDTSVIVRATLHAGRLSNRTPPFAVDGQIWVHAGAEVRHVPYSLHDCFQLHVSVNGSGLGGVVHDEERIWPSKGLLEPTWLLPPGDYDAMAFGNGLERPLYLGRDLHLTADRDVDLGSTPADRTLTWSITDEERRPLVSAKMDLVVRHTSGAGLGYVGFPMVAQTRMPDTGPGYTLEWSAYQDDGDVRHDIPGTIDAPISTRTVANDPSKLRRWVEHFEVAPGDSVLPVEFRLHPDFPSGEWGIAIINPFAPPTGASYDVVQWRAATPYPRHNRIGRLDWQVDPVSARGGPGDFVVGMGPPLAFDHGDTVGVHRTQLAGSPVLALTGTRLTFGTGPLVFAAGITAEKSDFVIAPGEGFSARLFTDMMGTRRAGPPASFEVSVDGQVVSADTLAGEGSVQSSGLYQRMLTLPPGGRGTLVVHAPEASVLGIPSHTTVRTGFPLAGIDYTVTPTLESFAVVAAGNVVDEVHFGQVRDPHVEFTTSWLREIKPVDAELFYRPEGAPEWTPLHVLATDPSRARFRASLEAVEGPVSLRLKVGTAKWGTLEMDVEPAFVGRRSPAADAPVLEASADGAGARVSWRMPATDAPLVVERSEDGGDWLEWGEVTPANGVAYFVDARVVPGKRYGYRLAGAAAVAWVQVPVGVPQLALALAPNPARGDVVVALGVDRTAPIALRLLDLQGRVMSSRRLDAPTPGVHVVSLVTSGRVPPGLYFVRLERGSDVITRRVTLLQ